VGRDVLVEAEIHDAGLDGGSPVGDVERDDLLEAMESEHHNVVSQRAAGETCSRSARDERHSFAGKQTHYPDSLVAVSGKDSKARLSPIPWKSIGVVNQQLTLPTEHVPLAHDFGQTLCDRGQYPRDRLVHP
jgi:hypothetical protein